MFLKRIKKLREDNEYTQSYVASKLKINRVVYNRYENGIRDVPIDILIGITKLYNVSISYILEEADIKNYDVFLKEIRELEESTICNKCTKKEMKHNNELNYFFRCSYCNNVMDLKTSNYCKN